MDFARRLTCKQYARLQRAEAGLMKGRPQALHDFRVALRRLRVLLRLFRKPLANTRAALLENRLRALSKALGPARDTEIIVSLLGRRWLRKAMAAQRNGAPFLERQRDLLGKSKALTLRLLRRAAYRKLKSDVRRLLFSELPKASSSLPVRKIGARAVRKALTRVRETSRLSASFTARELHLLRIACRRARYAAEFFSPLLGKPTARLGRRLNAVQDVLGDIHDQDVCLAHLRRHRSVPREAIAALHRRRRRDIPRFRKAWARLRRCEEPLKR